MLVFLGFIDATVPLDRKMEVIYGGGKGDRWFGVAHLLAGIVFFINFTLYPILGILRIRSYRRNIGDYYADPHSASLRWLTIVLVLVLITVPAPLTGLLMNLNVFVTSWFSLLGVLPASFIYSLLCFNLLSDNYVNMAPDKEPSPDNTGAEIDRKRFERYLHDKKPFLKPRLRVTDVAFDLCTNRYYVSSFVNSTYGMNFNRFINSCRLKELDRMILESGHRDASNLELVEAAGFSCYRSYLRAKQAEYDATVLKEF
jgi:AraC-like DNA-binding protein/uncharacterized membrane protein